MKKIKSLKGGSCLRFESCRSVSADRHNERSMLQQMNNNIDGSLTHLNIEWREKETPNLKIYWENCVSDYNAHQVPKQRKNYNPKTTKFTTCYRKDTWKKNMSAIKEGVLILKDGSQESFEKAMAVACELEKRFHLKVLRVVLHADEHRIDEKGNDVFNYHAHIVVSWYDWKNHKPFSLDPRKMVEIQDFSAEITGLPRGNPTGKYIRGLSNQEYKKSMAIINANNARKQVLMKEYEHLLKREIECLKKVGDDTEWDEDRAIVDDYRNKKEEIFTFIPMAQHPIAYINCLDRFEERIKHIRKRVEYVESYLLYSDKKENEYLQEKINQNNSRIAKQSNVLCELVKRQEDVMKNTPSPLQIIRFFQELRDKAYQDVQHILEKYHLTLEGMERRQNKDGQYFELLEVSKGNGTNFHLYVFEATGNIYSVVNGERKMVQPIPELSHYLKASLSDDIRQLLEEAYPITEEIKEKKARKKNKGISVR